VRFRYIHVCNLRAQLGSGHLGELTMGQYHRQPGANSLGKRTRMVRSDPGLVVTMLLVIFVILTAVACSRANEEPTNGAVIPTLETEEPTSTPLLTSTEPTNEPVLPTVESDEPGGFGALLSGALVVEDRCLYLVDEFGVRWLPVFKADTVSWERDTLVYRGQRFEIGERLWVGGGEASAPGNFPFLQAPHDSCDVRNIWLHITTVDREPPTRSSP
jgi:hypothetical protein